MGTVTLQTIFQDAFPLYEPTYLLPSHVRRAARAMMQCRTAALGGHVQACPDGHMSRVWYNSCRHRSCPQCAYLQTERWLALQRARLLACDHDPVLLTLPHGLNALWLANVPVMTTLVFQAVRDTLYDLLGDPTYRGAHPGIIAALHTWSQTLVLHPHVHGLVTGGGLTPAGQWVAVRNGLLVPVRGVLAVFRGTLLAAIRQAWACGTLVLPDGLRPQQCRNVLLRLGHPHKTPWNVGIMERYRHGVGVVTSLARALRGGPIKQARLVAFDGARATFLYRARHEGTASAQRMTLPGADCVQRWLLHVPSPRPGRSAPMACPITPTRRRWGAAGRRWGSRPWSSHACSMGRRPVPSGAPRTRNGVRPAGSGSCARGASHAGGRRHRHRVGSARHEQSTPEECYQGRGVSLGGLAVL